MAKIRVGCATMVEKDGKLLLGIRGKEPDYGSLVVPGGGVDFLENFEKTAAREIFEETGIKINDLKQFGTFQIIKPERDLHLIIIYWTAKYESGEVKSADDLLDASFYSREEIAQAVQDGKLWGINVDVLKQAGWL